ncbi:NUMOD4 motif-containing HNH endonuclease [Nocardia sp.]
MGEYSTEEIWLPVVGAEGRYSVSNQGRVRAEARVVVRSNGRPQTIKSCILKQATGAKEGYRGVGICYALGDDSRIRPVHHLVMEAFVGPRPEGMDTCHNNGDPGDNRLVNLRYDSRNENQIDAVRHGRNRQANKTHCPRGHAYDATNTVIHIRRDRSQRPERHCRPCANIRSAAYRDRQKAARKAA